MKIFFIAPIATLLMSSFAFAQSSKPLRATYSIYTNDVLRFNNKLVKSEIRICGADKNMCQQVAVNSNVAKLAPDKAGMIIRSSVISAATLDSALTKAKATIDTASLSFIITKPDLKGVVSEAGAANSLRRWLTVAEQGGLFDDSIAINEKVGTVTTSSFRISFESETIQPPPKSF